MINNTTKILPQRAYYRSRPCSFPQALKESKISFELQTRKNAHRNGVIIN